MKCFWVNKVVDLTGPICSLERTKIFKILDKKLTQQDCIDILKIKGVYK